MQASIDMPVAEVTDRITRDRNINRALLEFNEAALQGAMYVH